MAGVVEDGVRERVEGRREDGEGLRGFCGLSVCGGWNKTALLKLGERYRKDLPYSCKT